MRKGLLALLLVGSCVAVACGGSVLAADDDEDTEPAGTDANAAPLGFCRDWTPAMKRYSECTRQELTPDVLQTVIRRCERIASSRSECDAEFKSLTKCQMDALTACDTDDEDVCLAEEEAYLACVSGGACHSIGASDLTSASEHHAYLESYTTHEACECIDRLEGGAPGDGCNAAADCATICCACPTPGTGYSAAVCDKSESKGEGHGRCATAEQACENTAAVCHHQQARD